MSGSPVGDGSPSAGPQLTVVTGVPRSGTSLLMQMLARGGMPVTTDRVREPDRSNPRGYFEHEAVKRLGNSRMSHEELMAMAGTAVKIVAPLVLRLPTGLGYRVLLIRRDVAEIIQSQRRMLIHAGVPVPHTDETLARAIPRAWLQIRLWAKGNAGAALLELDYAEVLCNPPLAAASIAAFLGGTLDVEAMTGAVDPALHRCRAPLHRSGIAVPQTSRVP